MNTSSKRFRSLMYNIYKEHYGSKGVREFVNNTYTDKVQIQAEDDNYTGELLLPEHARTVNNQNAHSNPVLDYFKFKGKNYFLVAQM